VGWRRRAHPVPDRAAALYAVDGRWAIYWRDRNLKFHEYKRKRPTANIQALLDHIETSGDPIFWG
jgi:hypothetical protein